MYTVRKICKNWRLMYTMLEKIWENSMNICWWGGGGWHIWHMTFTLPYQDKVIEFQFSPIFSINVREHASYVHTTIFVLSDEQQYLYGEPIKMG